MEPHPFWISTTALPTLPNRNINIIFESTTLYYSIAPISYTTDVTSSIPYRDATVSQNSMSGERFSSFSTNMCLNQSKSSGNDETFNDDDPWNKCSESTEMLKFFLSNTDDSQANVATQQLHLSSDMQSNVVPQPLPLSSTMQANTTTRRLPSSSNLQTNRTVQKLPPPSVEHRRSNKLSQPLPLSSTIQTNVTAQPLRLSSNSNSCANVVLRRLPISSNLQTTQSLSLQAVKLLQTSDEFQLNLPLIQKMRMLHDQATHHARLAQDSWEEARAIAAYLNMPPPPLPDAVDFMTYSYLKHQKQWNLTKNANEQENIKPRLLNVKNSAPLSDLQSISKRIKPSSNANSSPNSNFNQLPFKISRLEKNVCKYTNAKFRTNRTEKTVKKNFIFLSSITQMLMKLTQREMRLDHLKCLRLFHFPCKYCDG